MHTWFDFYRPRAFNLKLRRHVAASTSQAYWIMRFIVVIEILVSIIINCIDSLILGLLKLFTSYANRHALGSILSSMYAGSFKQSLEDRHGSNALHSDAKQKIHA